MASFFKRTRSKGIGTQDEALLGLQGQGMETQGV